ncbi:DNA primase [Lysobacter korlensis]|uniref:DNA primase n=1 Tax=Lysobacter korlensis TaxID=553636 RepID=A0ABV6RMJ6_9GAMM
MPGLIRRSDIDEVRARTNIADVVGEYVTLKRAGVDSMKGLCPFHDERSPSFHVRPQAGRYHCFGCGEGGDVFSFLEKMDSVSFTEAVERLAGRIGFELRYEDGGTANRDSGSRARILAANRAAEEYFQQQLLAPEAEPGRKFLGDRGFDQAAAQRFGVGFAPKSYDALGKHLKSKGFTEQELVAAGLLGMGDRGAYDRFRGRLVWPIRDTTGQTLGFGARRLLDDDSGPKYLNTPETAVYHKSQVLYGLDLAKRDIARGKQVVVVEGYTDVMACHLAGVTTAIATCGTSFGVDHIKVVRRVLGDVENADARGLGEVIFTFDPDEAGQKAASRAFAEEQRFAAQTFVAVAPEGLDPCDLRLARGDDAVRLLIAQRRPMFEFMVRRVLAAHDLDTVEGRVGALRASAPIVAGIRDQSLSSGYVRNLAGWLGMDLGEVGRAVNAARPKGAPAPFQPPPARQGEFTRGGGTSGRPGQPSGSGRTGGSGQWNREGSGRGSWNRDAQGNRQGQRSWDSERSRQPDERRRVQGGHDAPPPDYYDAPPPEPDEFAPPAAPSQERPPSIFDLPADPVTRQERDALMALLQHPAAVGHDLAQRAAHVGFRNRALAVVRDAIAACMPHFEAPDWVARVLEETPKQFTRMVEELTVAPIPQRPEQIAPYCRDIVTGLIDRDMLRRKADLLGALQRTDARAEPDRYRTLQLDLVTLEADRRALRAE